MDSDSDELYAKQSNLQSLEDVFKKTTMAILCVACRFSWLDTAQYINHSRYLHGSDRTVIP